MHLMIDHETMGTGPTAAVVQLGAVHFDPYSDFVGESFGCNIDLNSMLELGCITTPETITWWTEQSPEARASLEDNPLPASVAMIEFNEWLEKIVLSSPNGIEGVWSHGASFDIPQLDFISSRLGFKFPWAYWNVRDTRTLFELAQRKGWKNFKGKTAHIAVEDCKSQILQVQRAIKWLRLDDISLSTTKRANY